MHTIHLRKVGGSVMLSVPPALLELLNLIAGHTVVLAVESGRLIVEPSALQRYILQELLEASDYTQVQPDEEREWVDAPIVGREAI